MDRYLRVYIFHFVRQDGETPLIWTSMHRLDGQSDRLSSRIGFISPGVYV